MKKRAFLSPQINPLVVATVRALMPLMKRTLFGGLELWLEERSMETLRRYKGERMLLLPNHPTGEEPQVLFDIATRLDEVFNFVAAREVFDWERGFRGWVLRRVGVYSVIRGAADRESFMMSKKILMEGLNRLVIFIEGEISRGNDTLIPFEPGVIQLAYWAQEALAKEAKKKGQDGEYPPVYVAPVAIRYYFKPGAETAIEQGLQNLEKAVGVQPEAGDDPYRRIRRIGEKILTVLEQENHLVAVPETTLTERVEAIKNRLLKKMEVFLELKPDPLASTLDRLREIRNTMDKMIHTYDDPGEMTPYERRIAEHMRLALQEFYEDLDRVVYFVTYNESYLKDHPSNERLIEAIRRLEKEVFGLARLTYPRVATVEVGDVISLKDHFAEYEADKKGHVKDLAARLEHDMEAMLARMQRPKDL